MKSILRRILLQFKVRAMNSNLITYYKSSQLDNFNAIWSDFERIKKYYLINDFSSEYVDKSWSKWSEGINEIYESKEKLLSFSKNPIIIKTMTGEPVIDKTASLLSEISPIFRKFLIEDIIGNNLIINKKFLTSAARVSHLYIASLIAHISKRHQVSLENVTELGGGFGGLMSIFVRSGYTKNFTIFDLPVILPLQYTYLNSVGSDVRDFDLASFQGVDKIMIDSAKNSVFISNWALTESTTVLQDLALKSKFFGSKHVFICCENVNYNHAASVHLHDFLKKNAVEKVELRGVLNNSKLYFLCFED